MNPLLLEKYNVPGPRYTSYPTVPYWENTPDENQWKMLARDAFQQTNHSKGISLYIHLPYCESLCTYCGCNTRITVNHSVEKPYMNALLKEWAMYLETFEEAPRISEIHLGGGTPTFFSAENLAALIEGISSSAIITKNSELSFEAHPNNTSPVHLQTLYNEGFRRLSLGIQDFDNDVQKAIHRIQSFEQVKAVTVLARKIGYTSLNFDLIYGLPFQTLNSIISTINKVKMLKPERIAFYSYAHVPWIKPAQRGYSEKDLPAPELKRKLYEMGREMLEAAGYIEIGMDHFALSGDSLSRAERNQTLYRNFMGYTTSKTQLLVGLGASSISDTWTAFAQNVKSVEGYIQKINEGKLPIYRGHILTAEDLILRQHILNIICRGETTWREENEKCNSLFETLSQLEELENDGLVSIEPFKLKVTEAGKPFVRNICMAFDARLKRNQPQIQLFSQTV
jgi:oxygen-independent coproporphyrinogen-3 oxidase